MIAKKNEKGLRIIKTGRTKEAINEAAKSGFRPLIKKVEPSPEIQSQFAVMQHKITGEIDVVGDIRVLLWGQHEDYIKVIDFTFHYPYLFGPFAAYLIPADLKVGEKVWIEDLIEDYIGSTMNVSNKFRLESEEAVWNGNDFEIQYNIETSVNHCIG